MDIDKRSTVLITCSPLLVDWLKGEVADLGYSVTSSHKAGVEIEADFWACQELNLHLRTAFNVLYLVQQFECKSPDQLYSQVSKLGWEDIIDSEEYLSVVSRVETPSINNSMFASVKVKDAIVDRIAKKTGERPDSGPRRENVVLHLYWKKDRCWLYLNSSGRKLADRGYRKMPHTAPMQETLAAAVVIATGYNGEVPFVVPMCGSGTLAIEAALLGLKKAPGLLRSNFGFTHIKGFDSQGWRDLRLETLKASRKKLPCPIIATDIDEKAVEAARKNAATAGVDHLIEFDVCDFALTKVPEGNGIIILNPEYGHRLGEIAELKDTYKRIGDFFKQKCQGYTGYVFTGNRELSSKIGLKAARRIPFLNADIDCRLLKYEIYPASRKRP